MDLGGGAYSRERDDNNDDDDNNDNNTNQEGLRSDTTPKPHQRHGDKSVRGTDLCGVGVVFTEGAFLSLRVLVLTGASGPQR